MKKCLLFGVGNVLCGDDYVGIYIAKKLKSKFYKAIACEQAIENYITIVEREKYDCVILVDCIVGDLAPGEIRVLNETHLSEISTFSSHNIPLKLICQYLKNYTDKVIFIGITGKNFNSYNQLSAEVKQSADKLINILKTQEICDLSLI